MIWLKRIRRINNKYPWCVFNKAHCAGPCSLYIRFVLIYLVRSQLHRNTAIYLLHRIYPDCMLICSFCQWPVSVCIFLSMNVLSLNSILDRCNPLLAPYYYSVNICPVCNPKQKFVYFSRFFSVFFINLICL